MVMNEFSEVFNLIENPSNPVVLELSGVQKEQLLPEEGSGNLDAELELLESCISDGDDPQFSFRLVNGNIDQIMTVHDLSHWQGEFNGDEELDDTWLVSPKVWLKRK